MLVAYLFYDDIRIAILLLPLGLLYVVRSRKRFQDNCKARLTYEFKDGMQGVVSALAAGYSVENAFREALSDIELMHGKKSAIYKGFRQLVNRISVNVTIEEAFSEFAEVSEIEEIKSFSEVLTYAKRSGGNLVEIIKETTYTIGEKIEVAREITTIISAKKLEQNVMNLAPMMIVLYMKLTNAEMFAKLYHNAFGIAIMSGCLLVYAIGKLIADRIVNIKI